MLNDRDEKYEGHEEGEYHFSDEEVSYEVESDSTKDAPAASAKPNLLNNLTRSRRMMISMGVFLVLVFVVFKMVAPTTTAPATDIVPAPVMANKAPIASTVAEPPVSAPEIVSPQAPPMTAPAMASMPAQGAAPVLAPAPTPESTVAVAQTAPVVSPAAAQPSPAQMVPVAPVNQPAETSMSTQAMPVAQPAAPIAEAPTPVSPQVVPAPVVSSMPIAPQAQQAPVNSMDAKVAAMNMDTEKLINQVQSEYSQKLNSYETENKALQDQLQTLNSRVGSMETQLNQLVQALIHQNQGGASNNVNTTSAPAQVQPEYAEPKISYNVQAIIPGRAWLKSVNGETITVAEGDTIKEFGRVTKIDPYDGVIEVNTGNKVVSLSYGNGA